MHQPDFFDSQFLWVYAARNFSSQCWMASIRNHDEAMLAFTTRYFLQRPHPAPDPRANFACLVNYVVDELVKYDTGDSASNEKLRYEYMHALCKWSTPTFSQLRHYLALPPSGDNQDAIFLAAVYLNKRSFIQDMLQDCRINLRTMKHGYFDTPLHAVTKGRHYDLVYELLQHGADINEGGILRWAIYDGREDIAYLLIQPQYGINTSDRDFEWSIIFSIQQNYHDLAWTLLDRLTAPISGFRYLLSEGLCEACRLGMMDIVNRLLDNGGDPNVTRAYEGASFHVPPIAQAAWTGQEEAIHLLLERGADVNFHGSKSIFATAWGGQINAAKILINAGLSKAQIDGHGLLTRAMHSMKPEAAEFLRFFQEGGLIDVHHLDKDPVKAEKDLVEVLVYAAAMGHVECLRILCEYGVDLDDGPLYSRCEYPPLIIAAKAWSQDKVVEYLLSIGVKDVDPLDTCVADDFRSGKFPAEPSPLLTYSMPYRA